jgi:hypothetical protein
MLWLLKYLLIGILIEADLKSKNILDLKSMETSFCHIRQGSSTNPDPVFIELNFASKHILT